MNTKRLQGLTLVELLISMAIMGIVLIAITTFFGSTSDGAVQVNTRAELQQDVLNVEQLLASRIREAWYVYTPDRGAFPLGTGTLRTNPLTGNGNWALDTVSGSAVNGGHLLALILPPENRSAGCTGSVTEGCYRFFAYYPVQRSVWVAGNVSNSANNPGAGPDDANTWVLAEFRANYPAGLPSNLPPQPLPGAGRPMPSNAPGAANYNYVPAVTVPGLAPPNTGAVNLLADNLAPMTADQPMFTFLQEPTVNNVHPAINLQEVVIRMAATQRVRGRAVRLPGADQFYELRAFPENLGRR